MPKKFDKKNTVKFVLSDRSQLDPLRFDDEVDQNVLVPQSETKVNFNEKDEQIRKSMQRYYGVEFDDDDDYMSFMKANPDGDETAQEGFLTKEQLYNQYLGTDIDQDAVDPEVVFKLEGDDLDEDMDDDFIMQLMEEGGDEEEKSQPLSYTMQQFLGEGYDKGVTGILKSTNLQNINENESVGSFDERQHEIDDRKSRFTEYSMSSSVMRRNAGLTRIDDDFEETVILDYNDEDFGELDHFDEEEMEANPNDMNDAAIQRLMGIYSKQVLENMPFDVHDLDEGKCKKIVNLQFAGDMDEAEMKYQIENIFEEKVKAEHDVQSILSTKSNLYNRPKFVDESNTYLRKNKITFNKKGFPVDQQMNFRQMKKSEKKSPQNDDLNSIADSQMTRLTTLLSEVSMMRNKDETTEERKQRKGMIKELRKARREERKNTRQAFREENIKQAKAKINSQRDTVIRL